MTQQDNVFASKAKQSQNQSQPSCHSERSEESSQSQSQHHEDEIDIIDYIKVAYKHRWMIITIILISMFFAGASSLMKPKMYEAQATFFPMNVKYSIQSQGVIMQPRLDIKDFIILILESQKMTDRVIEQIDLKKPAKKKLMLKNSLKSSIKIQTMKNGLIKLSAQSRSPEFSAKIANAYVDNLDYFNRQLDIGAQRNIVQVIDTATIPKASMPRETKKNVLLAGVASFMFAIFLAFFIEFIKKSNLKNRLKEN